MFNFKEEHNLCNTWEQELDDWQSVARAEGYILSKEEIARLHQQFLRNKSNGCNGLERPNGTPHYHQPAQGPPPAQGPVHQQQNQVRPVRQAQAPPSAQGPAQPAQGQHQRTQVVAQEAEELVPEEPVVLRCHVCRETFYYKNQLQDHINNVIHV